MFEKRKKHKQYAMGKQDIKFYIELAQPLALTYSEQLELLEEDFKRLGVHNNYMTHDIASDWIWESLGSGVMQMLDQNLITAETVELYKKLIRIFMMCLWTVAFLTMSFGP